jgi:hypothetical protein
MIDSTLLLANLPEQLRSQLLQCYAEIMRNYAERRWEPAELNGGKLCEVVYTIVHGAVTGIYAPSASKPKNMVQACQGLEGMPADANRVGDRSLRILLRRLLPFLYEIRNNRGVGHVGGDVSPNRSDAEAVATMASWMMAELVRVFHNVPLEEAQAVVDSRVERRHPLIWKVENTKRVLDPSLSKITQTLLLLYSETGWTDASQLCDWVEYSNQSVFKAKVLKVLHSRRLIEFDACRAVARISPLGVAEVESKLQPRP